MLFQQFKYETANELGIQVPEEIIGATLSSRDFVAQ